MNKNYLPFYNSLDEKEKAFWLECTKEELIDYLIANLNKIDKAIEYIKKFIPIDIDTIILSERQRDYLLEILGEKENE